jgi:hypothetical protein
MSTWKESFWVPYKINYISKILHHIETGQIIEAMPFAKSRMNEY